MIAVSVKPLAPGRTVNLNSLDGFLNDLFRPVNPVNSAQPTPPAANVLKSEKDIQLEVAAPGYQKNDFSIHLDENRLTISANPAKKEDGAGKFLRRGFEVSAFERVFRLPDTIDPAAISAAYENGILLVKLPFKSDLVKSINVL